MESYIKEVMDRFDEIIKEHWHKGAGEFISPSDLIDDIKSFIASEIQLALSKQREEIKEKIKHLIENNPNKDIGKSKSQHQMSKGYYRALSDIKNII